MLDEEPLNYKLEKVNFELYAHEKKDDLKAQTQIELNDYLISNTVTTNKIYKRMQQRVLKESESIHEVPRRNYTMELSELEAKKQLLFKMKNAKWDEAVKGFNELIQEINQIVRELQQQQKDDFYHQFVELSNSTKLALATTYFFRQNFEYGKKLVDELIAEYPNYNRPYIKKMEYFHTRGEYENANELSKKIENLKLNEKDFAYYNGVKEAFTKDWILYEKVIYIYFFP
jgi:hypothetical protein